MAAFGFNERPRIAAHRVRVGLGGIDRVIAHATAPAAGHSPPVRVAGIEAHRRRALVADAEVGEVATYPTASARLPRPIPAAMPGRSPNR